MLPLRQWFISATADEIVKLAKKANTSKAYLQHLAMGHRRASAAMAGEVADAANAIRQERSRQTVSDLPILNRGDLCEACAKCPYFMNREEIL